MFSVHFSMVKANSRNETSTVYCRLQKLLQDKLHNKQFAVNQPIKFSLNRCLYAAFAHRKIEVHKVLTKVVGLVLNLPSEHKFKIMNSTNFCGQPIEHRAVKYNFIILDSLSAIVSIFGNSIVLVTIWRTPRLHSPSNVLLAGLALSDLGVGLVCQTTRIVWILGPQTAKMANYVFTFIFKASTYLFTEISLFTVTVISGDRYLALRLNLRYRELVTTKRVLIALVIIWTADVITYFLFLATVKNILFLTFSAVLFLLCIVVMIWCYFKVFQIIRRYQDQIGAQVDMSNNTVQRFPNIARYKKSLFNMLYIVGFLIISYNPYLTVAIISLIVRPVGCTAWAVVGTFIYLNSCVNPVLYCWRMGEIRQAIKEIVTRGCR